MLHGLHCLVDTAKRSEHDDGPGCRDFAQWPKTLGVGQVDVEQYEVRGNPLQCDASLRPVERTDHVITGLL